MIQYQRKTIAEAIELFCIGHSYRYIGNKLGCGQSTVQRWISQHWIGSKSKNTITRQSKINDERESDRVSESGENAERDS